MKFLCVLAVIFVSGSTLEMEGGVIKDLVVSLDPVLGEENCGWMLRNIGELVKSVSVTLFSKTGGLVSLERVTVRLPEYWMCQGEGVEVEENDGGSDVDVVRDGGDPRSVQWGGCGIRGVNIQLPVEALARNDSTTVHTFTTQLHNFLFGTFLEDDNMNEVSYLMNVYVGEKGNILVEHVENLLIEANPLRLLLASRYFNSLTKPHNLIALVPALKKQALNKYKTNNTKTNDR